MPNKLPWRLLLILWVAAALLSCIGLGNVPLRDFDEATVARVALELHQGAGEAALLPTLWNEPYLNKAPGLHLIIAAVIGVMTRGGAPLGVGDSPRTRPNVELDRPPGRVVAVGAATP
ncbi:MAG: hypothetical protein ACJ0GY_00065 [Synechococcus sp.]